jgi:hypothetical protein
MLLLLAVSAGLSACGGDAPAVSDQPNGLMTVEQVRAEIEATKARFPLPEGAAWRAIELGPGTYEGPYAGGSMIEFQATCIWLLEARDAKVQNDQARFARAATILRQIPTWRLFTDPALFEAESRATILDGIDRAASGFFEAITPFLEGNCF